MSESTAEEFTPYYQQKLKYDPRFYESRWWNYLIVIGVLVLIYAVAAAFFAAIFYFGIHNAMWMDIWNLIVFGCTLLFLAWMLFDGS